MVHKPEADQADDPKACQSPGVPTGQGRAGGAQISGFVAEPQTFKISGTYCVFGWEGGPPALCRWVGSSVGGTWMMPVEAGSEMPTF